MIKKIFDPIDDIIATLALAVIISLTVINVFLRFVLNSPVAWAEEISVGLFIWLVFVGMSSAMKRDNHIGVDYFVNKMPRPLKISAIIIRALAIYAALIYVLIYLGSSLTAQAHSKVTPILAISYQYIDIAVPIGGVLTAIHFTRLLIQSLKAELKKEGGE
ncbi:MULTISPECIES: TRAP transporter small permease [Metabacillus]|uniref:C4-dicarboxylate ABC transporter permease n=2 Tax=Metabacillus TaxID=2675233 RepID=A0A179SWJ9_9BACI|nr:MULTISPECIES: TRAP transporter small permease [Metabacillus]OAS86005.1 C4-dicarboxylate ABC transporter permease [Metabacillus litoralis]QNF30046.1 TRAP transporter small permease [Metabacillus sp. KUDC1714]